MKYLLLVHFESGDEIHFTVVPYTLLDELIKFSPYPHNQEDVEYILEKIHKEKVASLMCQTYSHEDLSEINKYNIVSCIHLPELGC